jgi:hypothetical protein
MRDRIAIGFFLALSLVAGTATVAYAGQPCVASASVRARDHGAPSGSGT